MDQEISSLIEMAKDSTTRARQALTDNMLDLFVAPESQLSDRERALMDDILRKLITEMEASVRANLAEKLATREDVPTALIDMLAEDEISVARPILQKSNLLRDEKLVEIIRHRTHEHQLCIAMREELSYAVSDALVNYGDSDVLEALIQNRSAEISAKAMDYLVAESRRYDRFQEPLLSRTDLSAALANRMFWWVSASLRKKILTEFEIAEHELDHIIEQATRKSVAEAQEDRANNAEGTARKLVAEMDERGELTPEALINMLRNQRVNAYVAGMAQRANLPLKTVRRIIFDDEVEPLAVLCKATGFLEAHFSTMALLLMHGRTHERQSEEKLREVLELFRRISSDQARITLRYWHADSAFSRAIDDVG